MSLPRQLRLYSRRFHRRYARLALAYEAIDCPAHGDYVVVGVGGEYDYTLGVGGGPLRAVGVVGVGFPSGPAGDSALEVIENLYIELEAVP